MSKSLKKLIDINRLREFKNKLVGTGSAYVQTGAVDQTVAGTKTFSELIVGSVTGSSGSCTGNAATATNATYANWLRTSSHSDHLFHTEWDGAYFWTYVTTGGGDYRAVRVARSDSAATAEACTGNAATATNATNSNAANQLQAFVNDNFTGGNHYVKAIRSSQGWSTHLWMCYNNGAKMADEVSVNYANSAGSANTANSATTATTAKACTGNAASANIATKATQDAAGNTITTTYATKAENNTKANNSEVVHKSGDETIAGTKTFSNGVLITNVTALMAQNGGYTLVLRNDGSNTYLLMSDKGGVPGTWNDARPLTIGNSTGVCDINGNASTATKLATARTIALSGAATGTATSFDGSGNITIPVTALAASAIRAQWYAAYPDGAEAHNAMWGGRDITAAFDSGEFSEHVADGTFRDIFPGDYITKQVTIKRTFADDGTTELFAGGTYTVNWVVADCDYWWHKGDKNNGMETHHVAIVPQTPIFNARMNQTNTTAGGCAGSDMFRKIIRACSWGIIDAFGSDHILEFRDAITNASDISYVSSGIPQFMGAPVWWGEWVSVPCNLMSEKMVYGAPICSAGAMDNVIATSQMSAFRLSEKLINYNRQGWWLRDVVSSAYFAFVSGAGDAGAFYASNVYGVRPFALLV